MEMLSFGLPAPVKKKGQAQCLPLDRCGIKDVFRPPIYLLHQKRVRYGVSTSSVAQSTSIFSVSAEYRYWVKPT
jgi:hypothetical protein